MIYDTVAALIESSTGPRFAFLHDRTSFHYDFKGVQMFSSPPYRKESWGAGPVLWDFRNMPDDVCRREILGLADPPPLISFDKLFMFLVDDSSLKLFIDNLYFWEKASYYNLFRRYGFISEKAKKFGVEIYEWSTPTGGRADVMKVCDDERGSGFHWDDKRCVGEVSKIIKIKDGTKFLPSLA